MRVKVWASVLVLTFVCVIHAHAAERGDIVVRAGYSSVYAGGELSTVESVEADFNEEPPPPRIFREVQQTADLSVSDSDGLFVSAEYRVTDIFGIGLSVSQFDTEIEGVVRSSTRFFIEGSRALDPVRNAVEQKGTIDVMPVMASLNIHHLFGRVDFFFGARLGYVFFDGFELNGATADASGEIGFGWHIGADFPIGRSENWLVHASLAFVRANATIEVRHIDEIPDDFEDFEEYEYETNQGMQTTFDKKAFTDGALNVDPYELRIGVAYRF
jgi:outer membrane protein W